MKLSGLQKYILKNSYGRETKIPRSRFYKYYEIIKNPPKGEDKIKILTKSLERMIAKGLIIGQGEVTARKWYIKEIRLTNLGHRTAKNLLGEQTVLPLRNKRK